MLLSRDYWHEEVWPIPFKVVFKCSLARKLCSTMLLKGVVFFGWMFNGFKQVSGLSKDSPRADRRWSGRAFRLFLGASLPGSTPPDRFALRPSRVWLVNRRAGYLKKKAADEPLVFCLAVGKSSQFVINYFTLPHLLWSKDIISFVLSSCRIWRRRLIRTG